MARKKITPIEANTKTSVLVAHVEGFSQRFNIAFDKNQLDHFQNRCVNALSSYIYSNWRNLNLMSSAVHNLLGLAYTKQGAVGYVEHTKLYRLLTGPLLQVKDDTSLYQWLLVLECILNLDSDDIYDREIIVNRIAEALRLSKINAILCDTADGYLFYPANAELLDQKLVVDTLNWLNDYPKAKEQFNSALRLHLAGSQPRNVIDNLRLSVELFFKQILGNDASLENQTSAIGGYLKNHYVSAEIRNMYIKLLDYFTKYNDNRVKHDDQTECISNAQIEYLIYLTGTFLRLVIQLERESSMSKV